MSLWNVRHIWHTPGGPGTLIAVLTTLRRSVAKGEIFWTKRLDLLDYRYCLIFFLN